MGVRRGRSGPGGGVCIPAPGGRRPDGLASASGVDRRLLGDGHRAVYDDGTLERRRRRSPSGVVEDHAGGPGRGLGAPQDPGGEDGSWQYWAYPSGQAPTTFAATSANADSVTFENPEHDFPQSITYRRRPDSLVASIQGEGSSGYRQIFFAYRRIPCEAPNPG